MKDILFGGCASCGKQDCIAEMCTLKSLYDVTGNISDINTLLINKSTLEIIVKNKNE